VRIALVAPLVETVPPRLYGGTERVIATLVTELTAMGHDVTLYASGDSRPVGGRLIPVVDQALWSYESSPNDAAFHTIELAQVLRDARDYDVIHSHLDFLGFAAARVSPTPFVHTLHGRLDGPEIGPLFNEFSDAALISISNSQRGPQPNANWLATVYNGIAMDRIPVGTGSGGYLTFLGRISPEKGVADAIDIANRAGLPLKIAARMPLETIDNEWVRADWTYYSEVLKPRLDASPNVEFIGEVNDAEKYELLHDSIGLLFPINWPEPFGLVMIEALACGTPVVARAMASAPEVVQHGRTGFLCHDFDEMAAYCDKLIEIERADCRADAEARFSARAMARGYLNAYQKAITGQEPSQLADLVESTLLASGRFPLDPVA
jgi:glycosyltransferase involved in cell wall biosynthesis